MNRFMSEGDFPQVIDQFIVVRRIRNALDEEPPEVRNFSTCSVATQIMMDEARQDKTVDCLKTMEEKTGETAAVKEDLQNLLGSVPRLNEACIPTVEDKVGKSNKSQAGAKDRRNGRRSNALAAKTAEKLLTKSSKEGTIMWPNIGSLEDAPASDLMDITYLSKQPGKLPKESTSSFKERVSDRMVPVDGSKTREIVKAATAARPKLETSKGKATRK